MDICGLSAKVLIDSGATHFFINSNFAKKLNRTFILSNTWVSISTLSEDIMESRSILKACTIKFEGHTLFADLLILGFYDFDIILGMDWFSKYHANIDCHDRVMVFNPLNEPSFRFIGSKPMLCIPIISAMKARRMLNKGCMRYLASIVDASKEGLSVEEVPIVCEYPNVILDDLSGLPPDREIEFKIDLIPGTAPISKAPYRMAPAELKELKMQL